MDTKPKSKIEEVESKEKIREEAKRQALEKVKQKAVIVNVDELAEAEARKAADAYMTEDKGKVNFFKKLWKHTFFDEYYRQRQINRTREEIKNTDNIYTGRIKNDDRIAHENAMQGISERFISEYDGTLSKGEEKKLLDDKDPEVVKSSTDIKNLITDYAKSAIDDDAFKNEKTRILNNLNGQDEILKGASNYADNLFEIAKNARIAIEHGAKLEELDLDTNIIIGKAKSSLKTEAHFNLVDKGIDKMKKSKIGRFISPAVLSTAIGLAYSITVGVSRKVLSSKAAAIATLGGAVAVSSAFAGANESRNVAQDRSSHNIRKAEGEMEIEPGSKRREQMEKYGYQMENSNDLAEKLRSLMFTKDKEGKDVIRHDIKEAEVVTIMAHISDIEARNSLNAKNKIDLISYSNIGNVEKERTDLTILTARAKVELRKEVENNLKNGIPAGETFDSYLQKQTQVVEDSLLGGEKGITVQDKAFRRYKAGRIAKKMLQTAIGGLIIGGGIQEIAAFARDDVQGLVEGIFHHDSGATIQTPFENIHNWILGHPSHVDMTNAVDANFNGHGLKLPAGMSLLDNHDGTCDIMKGGQVVSDNISLGFGANGNLDALSITKLGEVGIIANTTHTIVNSTQEVTSNGNDYLNHHPGGTHHITRDGWYDNNTPKPIFDQNELKLQWGGGVGGAGVDANGNYVLDVSHMTSDGSFHNEFSVDAQEKMKDGGLKIILSLTQGTQHQVFEVPIDIHGNAVVDPNSEIGKLFFGTENGHAVFKGRFAEVVQSFGSHDGAEHVKSLATLVGHGNDSIKDIISTHIDNPITTIQPSMETQPQMFIPMVARRPLESVKYTRLKTEGPDSSRYLYLTGTEEDRKRWRENRSPRLEKNPDASLSQKEELEWYFKKQLKERGKGYIKELDSFIEQNKVLKNLRPDTKIAVCMPVAATQEYENIYDTLSLYAQQDKKAIDKTVIVMNVNWPDDADIEKVQKTLDSIEKAKKDFPNLQIATFTKVWPRKWIKEKEGKIYGEVVKYINDVALRSINKAGLDDDVYLLTNDADAKGMSKHYLSTLINSTEKNKSKDGFLGKIEWSPELYEKYPGYHLSMRMYQYLETSIRYASSKDKNVASSGANFLVKAGTFAAVGGYNANMGAGADTDLGRAIKNARFGGRETLTEEKFPIKYVNGAWIDTDPSRSFRYYKDGLPIGSQWENFDEGGYQPRGNVSLLEDAKEDIEKDFDKIIERSSFQITALIDNWIGFDKKEEYTRALNLAFPPQKSLIGETINLWGIRKDKTNQNEIFFTKEGEKWIKKQLKIYKEKNLSDLIYKRGLRSKNKIESEGKEEKPATVEVPVEVKETKEMISSEKIKTIIKNQLNSTGRIETINKLDLTFVDDKLIVDGDIVGKGLAGRIKIKGSLENNGDMIELGKDINIDANWAAKRVIKNNMDNIIPKIKEHFEIEYGKKIKSIKIEKGQVVLTFNE